MQRRPGRSPGAAPDRAPPTRTCLCASAARPAGRQLYPALTLPLRRGDIHSMRARLVILCLLAVSSCGPNGWAPPSRLVLWAWERPEDLRFAGSDVEIALQTGFVEIAGSGFRSRGRR